MTNQMTTNAGKESRKVQPAARQKGDYRGLVAEFLNFLEMPSVQQFDNQQPKIEVVENATEVMVTAEMPGVAEEDIDLELSSEGYLTISGVKHHEYEEEDHNGAYFSEISYGHVSRTIPLPWDLQFDKADAEYADGVLMVSIPKSAEAQQKRKKVNVKHAESGARKRKNKNRTASQTRQ